MKVLVLGASGFIGLPVAQAFVRAGHIVYGQTRSAEKAKQLAAEEIIPVVAEVENTAAYLPLVATLDAVVDVVGGMNIQATSALVLSATLDAVKQHRSPSAPKLAYVYTSGIWVHGDNRKDIITDTTPLGASPDLISWRERRSRRSSPIPR
ncbi:hypothetical protein A0H81_11340 [Grifola frondosa]|uniref:NAD(P)-binding domain-containing protein n=1 Tax=Grifola frondosa TaxID=5627 RepID=A0A1C7LVQ9_GRIFR|nr:hypothetical protein A0H81_11340 [Grifola frondosa]